MGSSIRILLNKIFLYILYIVMINLYLKTNVVYAMDWDPPVTHMKTHDDLTTLEMSHPIHNASYRHTELKMDNDSYLYHPGASYEFSVSGCNLNYGGYFESFKDSEGHILNIRQYVIERIGEIYYKGVNPEIIKAFNPQFPIPLSSEEQLKYNILVNRFEYMQPVDNICPHLIERFKNMKDDHAFLIEFQGKCYW